jgi:hypothetical protein
MPFIASISILELLNLFKKIWAIILYSEDLKIECPEQLMKN